MWLAALGIAIAFGSAPDPDDPLPLSDPESLRIWEDLDQREDNDRAARALRELMRRTDPEAARVIVKIALCDRMPLSGFAREWTSHHILDAAVRAALLEAIAEGGTWGGDVAIALLLDLAGDTEIRRAIAAWLGRWKSIQSLEGAGHRFPFFRLEPLVQTPELRPALLSMVCWAPPRAASETLKLLANPSEDPEVVAAVAARLKRPRLPYRSIPDSYDATFWSEGLDRTLLCIARERVSETRVADAIASIIETHPTGAVRRFALEILPERALPDPVRKAAIRALCEGLADSIRKRAAMRLREDADKDDVREAAAKVWADDTTLSTRLRLALVPLLPAIPDRDLDDVLAFLIRILEERPSRLEGPEWEAAFRELAAIDPKAARDVAAARPASWFSFDSAAWIRAALATPPRQVWREAPLPERLRRPRSGTEMLHGMYQPRLLDFARVIRREARGGFVYEVRGSRRLIDSWHVLDVAYFLRIRREDGTILEDLYLGLVNHRPYVIRAPSELPLLSPAGEIQLEVDIREVDDDRLDDQLHYGRLPFRRWADHFMITAPLDELRRDSDGDGLSDLLEERLLTDPMRPDTDGDGIPDRDDACPLAVAVPESDEDQILEALVRETHPPRSPDGEREGAGPLLVVEHDIRLQFRIVKGWALCLSPDEWAIYRRRFGFKDAMVIELKLDSPGRASIEGHVGAHGEVYFFATKRERNGEALPGGVGSWSIVRSR